MLTRSEAVSLLVMDECVTGDSEVIIKDKITGVVEKVSIDELVSRLKD